MIRLLRNQHLPQVHDPAEFAVVGPTTTIEDPAIQSGHVRELQAEHGHTFPLGSPTHPGQEVEGLSAGYQMELELDLQTHEFAAGKAPSPGVQFHAGSPPGKVAGNTRSRYPVEPEPGYGRLRERHKHRQIGLGSNFESTVAAAIGDGFGSHRVQAPHQGQIIDSRLVLLCPSSHIIDHRFLPGSWIDIFRPISAGAS
jgi:hypothetical protein